MSKPMELVYRSDIDAPLVMRDIGTLLAEGDQAANRVTLHMTDGGTDADLSGCTGAGYFRRSDGNMVVLPVTVSGSSLTTLLPAPCYAYPGPCQILLQLEDSSGMVRTVLWLTGRVQQRGGGGYIDPGERLPTLDELLEQVEILKSRTAALETQTAALKQSGYNVVDNGDFRAPINQRGNTTHSGAGYWLDRWTASTSAFRGKIVSGGINIWSATGAETHLIQYIPITGAMSGKACTLAIKVGGAVYTGTASFTSDKTITFGGGFVYIAPKNGNYMVQISTSSTTAILIEWVALYIGTYTADTLPAYQPKGYAAELAECMRYYREVYRVFGEPVGNVAREAIILNPPMRILPTATVKSLWKGTDDTSVTVINITATDNVDVTYAGYGNLRLSLSADL